MGSKTTRMTESGTLWLSIAALVFGDTEDDGDYRRRGFGRDRGGRGAGRGDDRHLAPDQIGYQRRYAIVLSL